MGVSISAAGVRETWDVSGRTTGAEKIAGDNLFVMAGPLLKEVRARAEVVAGVNVPVLLLGETGTGKDVIARLIHQLSSRAHRPFYKVNCAAVPGELLESELFGYEAGAFTGAVRAKPGHFQACDGGTLYLDEIGEMPPHIQAKLLHVLQDRRFCRLGSCSSVAVDVRIVAATNVNISDAIAAGRMREDLYYRLSAFTICLPPLRKRPSEIAVFFRYFMQRFAEEYSLPAPSSSPALMEACLSYSWPGNVRELENFVRRYLVLGNEAAAMDDLRLISSPAIPENAPTGTRVAKAAGNSLKSRLRSFKKAIEIEVILEALEQTHWNRTRAAARLDISPRALRYKMREYGIGGVRATAAGELAMGAVAGTPVH